MLLKQKLARFWYRRAASVDASKLRCIIGCRDKSTNSTALQVNFARGRHEMTPSETQSDTPTLLIVDEHEIVRDGISSLFSESGCATVLGFAGDGYTAIKQCRTLRPDIVLMDLGITRPNGMETFRKIKSINPVVKIVVYSSEAEKTDVFSLLAANAVGFIPKQAKGSDFVNVIRSASLGYVCVPSDFMEDFVGLRRNVSKTGNVYGLSLREMEIFEACVSGARTKEIAERLDISSRTVETHRNAIYRKTSCHNLSDLMEIAARLGVA